MNKEKLNDIICESSSDYDILNDAYNYIENLEQKCKKQKEVLNKIFSRITLWKMEDITMETSKVLDELLDILKEATE